MIIFTLYRDFGQPTGTEKKWAHEGKFLTNWIESAKLSDKPRKKEQKEAKKKEKEEYKKEKMKVLKEITGHLPKKNIININDDYPSIPLSNNPQNSYYESNYHQPSLNLHESHQRYEFVNPPRYSDVWNGSDAIDFIPEQEEILGHHEEVEPESQEEKESIYETRDVDSILQKIKVARNKQNRERLRRLLHKAENEGKAIRFSNGTLDKVAGRILAKEIIDEFVPVNRQSRMRRRSESPTYSSLLD